MLTQKDIDALIRGGAVSESATAAVPYNFRQPARIARDRQTTLEDIHGRFAVDLQGLFTTRLRQQAEVRLSSVELVSFGEYVMSIGTPCASFALELGLSDGGQAIMDFDARLAPYLVDRLFGGPGEGGDEGRQLTLLEQRVLTTLAERMIPLLRDAWSETLGMAPSIVTFEHKPDALLLVAQDATVMVANIAVASGGGFGTITFCLPLTALDGFLRERESAPAPAARNRSTTEDANRRLVEQHLRHASVPLVARLPVFTLPARDIASLHVGQILPTGQRSQGAVELYVNGRRFFLGTIGRHQASIGLRLTENVSTSDTPVRPLRRTKHS